MPKFRRQRYTTRMFCDDYSIRRQCRVVCKKVECLLIIIGLVVRRVKENNIESNPLVCQPMQQWQCTRLLYLGFRRKLKLIEVAVQGLQGSFGNLSKKGATGTATERLNAYRASPGKQVDEYTPSDAGGEHVKKGLSQSVAGGADITAFRNNQWAGAKFTSNDSHGHSDLLHEGILALRMSLGSAAASTIPGEAL